MHTKGSQSPGSTCAPVAGAEVTGNGELAGVLLPAGAGEVAEDAAAAGDDCRDEAAGEAVEAGAGEAVEAVELPGMHCQ